MKNVQSPGTIHRIVEELQVATAKLLKNARPDHGAPERITIEVLRQLTRENPAKMSQVARDWLGRGAF